MKLLQSPEEIRKEILRCIKYYEKISFAVAWIKENDVYEKLLKNKDKIKQGIFGVDFLGTDPKILIDFENSKNVKIFKTDDGSTFHPKIYLFYNIKKYEAIVGSANLTEGGMHNNEECAVLFSDSDSDEMLEEIQELLADYFDNGKEINNRFIQQYSEKCDNKKEIEESINDLEEEISLDYNKIPNGDIDWKLDDISETGVNLAWGKTSKIIISEKNNAFNMRIEVLNEIQKIFNKVKSYGKMDIDQRNKIIGAFGEGESNPNSIFRAFGQFMSRGSTVTMWRGEGKKRDIDKIIKAVDSIEIMNNDNCLKPIDEEKAREYLETVTNIYGCGITAATRALAVKRPDLFLCINRENNKKIKELFGFKVSSIDEYIKLLKIIYDSDYFKHKVDNGNEKEKQLSKYRVAMLDGCLYDWFNQ